MFAMLADLITLLVCLQDVWLVFKNFSSRSTKKHIGFLKLWINLFFLSSLLQPPTHMGIKHQNQFSLLYTYIWCLWLVFLHFLLLINFLPWMFRVFWVPVHAVKRNNTSQNTNIFMLSKKLNFFQTIIKVK